MAVLDPSSAVPSSTGGSDYRDPRHARSATVEVKPMHDPMPTSVRIDGRAGREVTLLALTDDPVALVPRWDEKQLASDD
jgi:hypothetical protein